MFYKLNGREPVECTAQELGDLYKSDDRIVARTELQTGYVSTVFLGLNHNFSGEGKPLLFETIFFTNRKNSAGMTRASTWEGALQQHAEMVKMKG